MIVKLTMSKKSKILLVSGCSNTDENFYSEIHPDLDTSWPKWPELLAKKLDMDCVNLGKSGAGNEYIYTSLLNYIVRNDTSNIGLVIPAWSQCQRKDFQQGNNGRWTNERIDPHGDVFSWVTKSLTYYLSFQVMCERYNLSYLQVQMLDLYQDWLNGLKPRTRSNVKNYMHKLLDENDISYVYPGDKQKDTKKVTKIINDYENIINTKKFIGWPLSRQLGGFSLQKELVSLETKTKISDLDSHPTALGHEKIMEFIYDRLD
jgi:hypothetical protein